MLIIVVEGGLISSVSSDDPSLRERLNIDRVAVLDYDTEGLEASEMVPVAIKAHGQYPADNLMAYAYVENVEPTVVDTEALAKEFDNM